MTTGFFRWGIPQDDVIAIMAINVSLIMTTFSSTAMGDGNAVTDLLLRADDNIFI
jgi:hypothetical protein